jgi:hypothetical protein
MRFDHDHSSAERIIPLDLGVRQDAAVPAPWLLQTDRRCFLIFSLAEPPGMLGIVEWLSCAGAVLGGLNDEAFAGHPLYRRGLEDLPYGAGEVVGSAWVRELDAANAHGYLGGRANPPADVVERVSPPSGLRHFILEFHDSSFECVATEFVSYATGNS